MATYSVFVIGESQISISGGETLDGITQGDGSHLLGETIVINDRLFEEVLVDDLGGETNFADNDGNQTLDGDQTIDGVFYSDGTGIEAEYQFDVIDDNTGIVYTLLAVNFVDSSPPFATNEALAFVDMVPPEGVTLRVISTSEGPSNMGPTSIDESELAPVCFAQGTRITTPSGDRAIEDLKEGDLVLRMDSSVARLRKVLKTTLDKAHLEKHPNHRPIRILAGALGKGLPLQDLYLSPQHRVLMASKIVQRMWGEASVLVAAKSLTELPGIFVDERWTSVTYYHLLFDRHEIIMAQGTPCESLLLGKEALKSISPEARLEILELFPECADYDFVPEPSCHVADRKRRKTLIRRHKENGRPALESFEH